jgi:hypothetical protein
VHVLALLLLRVLRRLLLAPLAILPLLLAPLLLAPLLLALLLRLRLLLLLRLLPLGQLRQQSTQLGLHLVGQLGARVLVACARAGQQRGA